jgi:RNA polymerase sigma-70 factor (sigma-E family)
MSGEETGGTTVRQPSARASDAAVTTYEEFVVARSAALYRTAYLLAGSRADAEDLLQTALIKVYVGWRKVSAARSPEAYARRVLVNAFMSGRRPARFTREQLVTNPPEDLSIDPDPHDRLTIWPHVSALPPRQRAVVVLRYYGGLSEAEIADALGCAPGTVKSTAAAALKTLRGVIGEEA